MRDALDGDGRTDAATPRLRPAARRAGPGRLAAGAARRAAARRPDRRPRARTSPGSTSCSSTSTGCPGTGCAPGWPPCGCCCRCCRCRPVRGRGRRRGDPDGPARRRRSDRCSTPWPTRRTGCRRCPASRRCSSTTSSPGSLAPQGRLGGLVAAFAEGAPAGSPVRDATCLAVDPDLVADGRGDAAAATRSSGRPGTVPGTGAEVAGTLARHAGGGRPRRLRRCAALRRRRPRRARPRAARRPGRHGCRRRGRGGHRGPRDAGAGGHHVAQRRSARRAGARHRRRGRRPRGGALRRSGGRRCDGGDRRGGPARRRCVVAARGAHRPPVGPPRPRHRTPPPALSPVPSRRSRQRRARRWPPRTRSATLVFRSQDADGQPVVVAPPHVVGHGRRPGPARCSPPSTCCSTRAGCRPAASPTSSPPDPRHPAGLGARPTRCRPAAATSRPRYWRPSARCAPTCSTCARPPCPTPGSAPRSTRRSTRSLQAALRPTSATWHGRPDLARSTASSAATRIGELRDSIRVLDPPSPYSLGTSDAPLLLTVANGLPVHDGGAGEHLQHHGPADRADPAAAHPAAGPAAGAGQRGGRAVGAVLGGGDRAHARRAALLGPPSRLQVRSTAYGTITVWLTGSAGVLLDRPGGAPGGAPDPGRGEPARPGPARRWGRPSTRPRRRSRWTRHPGIRERSRRAPRRRPGPHRFHARSRPTRNPRRRRSGPRPTRNPRPRPVPARRP